MNHMTVLLEHCHCWTREVSFLSSNKAHAGLQSPIVNLNIKNIVSLNIYCVEMNMELWLSN